MLWQAVEPVWPILAFLAYLLVTCTLTILAAQRRHAVTIHDRVRESKRLRSEYLKALENKQATY